MTGQWRTGFNGPTGLDYSLALSLMERLRLDDAAHEEMLDALHTMEQAALEEMTRKAED